ncbi:uncharacterized protein Z519_00840 [Cladophialophora bantiana CBS 173.52]|uniref:Uncharacterized protein n=1 Tax=Cladophialophora bantiana (strain ATCC 10958 / CBS 173.52 / CDC B-1940 / NIH 8579) TaxID=1442370 RepID=A0A0D2GLB1_CLAB1|nr:uncharacterized protein Z519_00840 [Cladophialophora bantiana CBS 173.52]KIW99177.1 hypothetical protein Z519_00840 [Cladophialophora bantiana CBS 173.52]
MFEVPDAKRVKRSALFREDDSQGSRASTRSVSPVEPTGDEGENIVEPTYCFEYDFIAPRSSSPKPPLASSKSQLGVNSPEEEQEYQFRLFASTSKSTAEPSKPNPTTADSRIRLSHTPEPVALADSLSLDKAQFLRPNRPDSYYFTSALPEEMTQVLRSQYADVAVSSSDVISRAKSTKWPGAALPWRLIHVELLGKGRQLKDTVQPAGSISNTRESKSSPKRPSKKRRILLRRRLALRQELAAQTRAAEETEREKRTRRNREKKVKRKEREKRKKLEAPEADGKHTGDEEGEGDERGEVEEDILAKERHPKTDGDVKPNSDQKDNIRSERNSASPVNTLVSVSTSKGAATIATSTNASKSSAPTRRAPTSRALTAAVRPPQRT